jgi:HPt (histidine-containing phosphotransfer) domain-containing protein
MAIVDDRFAGALSRLDGDRELFSELATYFVEDAPKLIEVARAGFANRNAETVGRLLHALRGLLANFDADLAIGIAKSIEQQVARGEWQAVPSELERLAKEVDALRRELHGLGGADKG